MKYEIGDIVEIRHDLKKGEHGSIDNPIYGKTCGGNSKDYGYRKHT